MRERVARAGLPAQQCDRPELAGELYAFGNTVKTRARNLRAKLATHTRAEDVTRNLAVVPHLQVEQPALAQGLAEREGIADAPE